jgi:phosphate uptake regulator
MGDESRKLQSVGYSTLAVSLPRRYVREMKLEKGDSMVIRTEADGTLRLIPATRAKKASKATIRIEQVESGEMLVELIVGAYALGYDTVEVIAKSRLDKRMQEVAVGTIRRLMGMEVVDSDDRRIVGQSFMDPTRFPVDSLIKRLQILVSQSLEKVATALDLEHVDDLSSVTRTQQEIDELYWLIVRQLLVALNRRELASEIGIESPLHASGDRVSAKTLDEIGKMVNEMAEELVKMQEKGTKMDPEVARSVRKLAAKATETFSTTMESLLTPDIRLVSASTSLADETLRLEKSIVDELLEKGEYGYARVLVSHLGQLARYCKIIIEIASHRLLRKSSRAATIQQ